MYRARHLNGFELRRRVFCALALALEVSLGEGCVAAGGAFGATNVITPYSVRTWQTDDGLPQNSVYAIAQTGDGYIWVGTGRGWRALTASGSQRRRTRRPAAAWLDHRVVR